MRRIPISEHFDEGAACQVAECPDEKYERERGFSMSGSLGEIGNDRTHTGDDTSIKHEGIRVREEVDYFRDAHFLLSLISIFIY